MEIIGFRVEKRREKIRLPENVSPNWVTVVTRGERQDIYYGIRGKPELKGHTVVKRGEIVYARTMRGTVLKNK